MDKLLEIEKSVMSNSIPISDLTRVDAVAKKSENTKSYQMDSQLSTLVAKNKHLWDRVDELDAYKKNLWNLRISGIPEVDGENVKMATMDIFLQVSPCLADVLQTSINVAQQAWPKIRQCTPSQDNCTVPFQISPHSYMG